jgi:hypothetical protein
MRFFAILLMGPIPQQRRWQSLFLASPRRKHEDIFGGIWRISWQKGVGNSWIDSVRTCSSQERYNPINTSNQKLCQLQTHVAAMKVSCDEAETQLALTNESSKMLLERAGNLRDER